MTFNALSHYFTGLAHDNLVSYMKTKSTCGVQLYGVPKYIECLADFKSSQQSFLLHSFYDDVCSLFLHICTQERAFCATYLLLSIGLSVNSKHQVGSPVVSDGHPYKRGDRGYHTQRPRIAGREGEKVQCFRRFPV